MFTRSIHTYYLLRSILVEKPGFLKSMNFGFFWIYSSYRFDPCVSELNKLLWISRSQPKVIGSTDTTLPCQVQQVQPVGQFDYCQDFSYLKNFFTKPFIEIQCGKMVQRIVTGLEGLQKAFQKICFVSRKKLNPTRY